MKIAAAWLIEKAGFKKGFALGQGGDLVEAYAGAGESDRAMLSCEELIRLRDLIVLTVEQRFGVTLEHGAC